MSSDCCADRPLGNPNPASREPGTFRHEKGKAFRTVTPMGTFPARVHLRDNSDALLHDTDAIAPSPPRNAGGISSHSTTATTHSRATPMLSHHRPRATPAASHPHLTTATPRPYTTRTTAPPHPCATLILLHHRPRATAHCHRGARVREEDRGRSTGSVGRRERCVGRLTRSCI